MSTRTDYFADLIADCRAALESSGIPESEHPRIIAALLINDSINGLRKALLQIASREQQ